MQLLTVTQVAEQAGLSEWAVRRAIHDGELVASKLRGRLRIDAVDVQSWVDAARVTPTGRASLSVPPVLSPAAAPATSFRARARAREARR